jgi:hypothetical protein
LRFFGWLWLLTATRLALLTHMDASQGLIELMKLPALVRTDPEHPVRSYRP